MKINDVKYYYHGAKTKFESFDGSYTGGIGFHFAEDINHAMDFGKHVAKCILRFSNPASLDVWRHALNKSYGGNPRKMAVDYLKSCGFDAVQTSYETIVFDVLQIQIVEWLS